MNSRLEQFVRDHREEFDGEEPDKRIWEGINAEIDPKKKQARMVRFNPARWSAAAAVILVVAGMGWYLSTRSHTTVPAIAQNDKNLSARAGAPGETHTTPAGQTPAGSAPAADPTLAQIRPKTSQSGTQEEAADNSMDEEMYHYARLVEIKHNQLKAIEKDEPLLYKQFASDVSKLDSVYHTLQSQLPKNPNREQLLEAMLQNLQLQMGLLNHQLDIIKQINHSKQTEYEKAHKTT